MSNPTLRAILLSTLLGLVIAVLIVSFFKAPFRNGNPGSAQTVAPVPSQAGTDAPASVQDLDTITETIPPSQLTGSVSEISALSTLTNQVVPSAPAVEQRNPVQKANGTATNSAPPLPQTWTNSLGMEFVTVPGTEVLFCVWLTRIKDYQVSAVATRTPWVPPKDPMFPVGPLYPIINVSYYEAVTFCKWLTERERSARWLAQDYLYRLPTEHEWVLAACPEPSPAGHATQPEYPWGSQWPPRWGTVNLHPSLNVDGFPFTSPVGSFPPNKLGLYDISGNASQWCEYDNPLSKRRDRPRPGGSWAHFEKGTLRCASSGSSAPERGQLALGFRITLGRENR